MEKNLIEDGLFMKLYQIRVNLVVQRKLVLINKLPCFHNSCGVDFFFCFLYILFFFFSLCIIHIQTFLQNGEFHDPYNSYSILEMNPENTRIGFVGIGVMGKSTCRNMMRRGYKATIVIITYVSHCIV